MNFRDDTDHVITNVVRIKCKTMSLDFTVGEAF